jgi:S1-C subfamily serine protease
MLVFGVAALALIGGHLEIARSPDFSRTLQTSAITATVRVVNVGEGIHGSGVIVGRKGRFAYVLTAAHIVGKASRLKVATFSMASYPRPQDVYATAEVLAVSGDIRDLALLRVPVGHDKVGKLVLCPRTLVPEQADFPALTVGCSAGAAPTCQVEKVLARKRIKRDAKAGTGLFWEVGREYQQGRSGGALIDARGHVLGILSGTSEGRSYFCHAEEIRAFLNKAGVE